MPLLTDIYRDYRDIINKGDVKMNETLKNELKILCDLEQDIIKNGKINHNGEGYFECNDDKERLIGLSILQGEYNYGWYIASETLKEQLKSINNFKNFILDSFIEKEHTININKHSVGIVGTGKNTTINKLYKINKLNEIATKLDILQNTENNGNGIDCIKTLIKFLKDGKFEDACVVANNEWDKISSYNNIAKYIIEEGLFKPINPFIYIK